MIDLPGLLEGLAAERPIFHSEADFQHELAWRIHQSEPEAQVRLEYRAFRNESRYTDIWVRVRGTITAFELKYPTRQLQTEVAGELFVLRSHAAQDLIRYDFVKDMTRLERIVAAYPGAHAYAILLTNDSSYWGKSFSETTADAAFRVHDGAHLTGELAWAAHTGASTMRGREQALILRRAHKITWHDYSTIPGVRSYNHFRLALIPIHEGSL